MAEKKDNEKDTDEKKTSMEKTLESSKEMGTELQNLIGALSQGKGSYYQKRREEAAKKKAQKEEEKKKAQKPEPSEPETSEPEAPKLSPDTEQSKKIAEDYVKESTSKSVKSKPSFMEEGEGAEEKTIYKKLEEFITKFFEGNQKKYDEWESSVNSFVSVLRKMRKITKNNTKQLLNSIEKIEEDYKSRLEQFELKRDGVENIADIEMDEMAEKFNKVMGLMSIQLKDYELKRLVEDIYF